MANAEYFIDPPDYLTGTLVEWRRYLERLKKIKEPTSAVRLSIAEAEERVAALS